MIGLPASLEERSHKGRRDVGSSPFLDLMRKIRACLGKRILQKCFDAAVSGRPLLKPIKPKMGIHVETGRLLPRLILCLHHKI